MRLALGRSLKAHRQKKRLTQSALAKRLGSSQSRIAKMEGGDASVSLDLLIQGLLALGGGGQCESERILRLVSRRAGIPVSYGVATDASPSAGGHPGPGRS